MLQSRIVHGADSASAQRQVEQGHDCDVSGDAIDVNLEALQVVHNVRFVSSLLVCGQYAMEMMPNLPRRAICI